jgi:hypothetical protein
VIHSARSDDLSYPQARRRRMILPAPIGWTGLGEADIEPELLASLDDETVVMMGDSPLLERMPERPTLLDFYRLRFGDVTRRHLLHSAKLALDAGQPEPVVIACLVHDIANGCLIRSDHGYWGAQLVEPYVSEEVAFAIRYHQALRYFPDESVGYEYPAAYDRFFGPDFEPAQYLRRDHEVARAHRWYMTARMVTIYDVYSFDQADEIDPDELTDVIGRNFAQPREGLGFDGSPVAHMWRSMIWPTNFL